MIPPRLAWMAAGVGLLLCAGAAPAAANEGDRVLAVEARGNRTVAAETILANVQTKPGNPYRATHISEDIRRLYALGYFTDVRVDVETMPDGLKVVFVVAEKPTVQAIELQGNRRLAKPKAMDALGVATGELYDARKLKEAAEALKAEYVRRGFSEAEVVSRAEVEPVTNSATLYVLVDEGPRIQVRRVLVEGNQAFSDRRLRKLIKTRRRWWFLPALYNDKVLEEDRQRIAAFYRKHGYQDVAVTHEVLRDPEGRGLHLHVTVAEGLQHRVGQVLVKGAVLFPEREIRQILALTPGAAFTTEQLQEDVRLVKQYYGDRGYIHAEVLPDPQLDPDTKRVNLTYHITEQELVRVSRIDIRGNFRTKDEVARRQLRIYPGDVFDGAKIRKSIERLYNLGYFEEVNVETEPAAQPDQEDLVFRTKETKTGSFSFGGGFSSVDRLVGLIELEQRNFDWRNWRTFTGAGQDLRLRAEIGTVRRYFDISFTEPWIFGRPVSFGIDLYNRTRLRSRNLGLAYEEERRGGGVRLGREFRDEIQMSLGYQLFNTEISDVVAEASADLKAEEGESTTSVSSLGGALDRRDSRLDPTKGYYLFLSGDLAGGIFGGDNDFFRLQAGASHYWPSGDKFVFESRVRTGLVNAYSGDAEVPIFERFFGGGSGTIRGFRERRVGPRDPTSNDPIGGEATLLLTAEGVYTLMEDERGRPILKGTVFYDAGDVWRRVEDYAESLKSGVGVGARMNTPIGPLRLDLGFPLTDVADEARKPRFHFNISRSF
ncbi:MAG: outer membrane protein assembly factor BamA [Candidatus Omnitrophica bacterium]|nr:outer membrane protein assembly factor BamA [Candidatus Omnitrophota bacterium]